MARYVVTPEVALLLGEKRLPPPEGVQLLAPTLLRSELLALLYRAVQRGEITRKEAQARLDHLRGLRLRLLGDRVLQEEAWKVAEQLGWPDTLRAEYVALTRLQADALWTVDGELARAVAGVVPLVPIAVSVEGPSPEP